MLVLRRRSNEAIVFEGGLSVTVVSLVDRRAWLGFEGPDIARARRARRVLAAADEEVCLGIRSPASVEHRGRVTSVTVAPSPEGHEGRDDAVLLLRRRPGESLEVNGLSVSTSVSPAGEGHIAHLHVRTPRLADTISLSVLSASGVEARIGVRRPRDTAGLPQRGLA